MRFPKHVSIIFLIILLVGMAFALSRTDRILAAGDGSEKIERALLERLLAEGQSDFIVRFAEQADLSAAYGMDWNARGWYVYNTLTETAQRSQARAQATLDAQGVAYRSFFAGNELYVYAGNLEQASGLARLGEVARLYLPPLISTTPLETANAVLSTAWAGELLANHAEITVLLPDIVTKGIENVNANDFWTIFNVRGEGILVANIDTGVRLTHEALASKYACSLAGPHTNCWYDPDDTLLSPYDGNGHGTHTMGTMIGSDPDNEHQIGMAPNARWIACQGCDTAGCETVDLLACADWILAPGSLPENRPHVVNNSWGDNTDGSYFYQAQITVWRASGIFPAFSAGNNGPSCDSLGDPGSLQEAFASAAHDTTYELEYSIGSRGPSFYGHEPYTKPNISAPGVDVTSSYSTTDIAYATMHGTSMASPHSAGAVALLWSCNPSLIGQIDTTFQLLQNSARTPRLSTCGGPLDSESNYSFGYGYLDVWEAGLSTCSGGSNGVLSGYVYDEQGSPLAGAVVKAESPSMTNQRVTDTNGYYSMGLLTGIYDVTASLNGYADQTVSGVAIVYHESTNHNFYLPIIGLWTAVNWGPCTNLTRFDAEYFPATGKVYTLGGRYVYLDDAQVKVDTTDGRIFSFDPLTGVCTPMNISMPIPVSNYTISLLEFNGADVLCTFGGRTATGAQTLAVQCYDPVGNQAVQITNLPADPYTYAAPGAQVVFNNQVYLFGGIDLNPSNELVNLDHTFRYDPVTNDFTQLGPLSMARGYILAAVADGHIYAFGGDVYNGDSNLTAQTLAEVMLDPMGAGAWSDAAVADLPWAAGEGRAFGFDLDSGYQLAGKIVIAGLPQYPGASYEVITYDPLANAYDLNYPNLNVPRRNHAAVFVPLITPNPADGLPGMWVLGGFCTGGACGGDLQPYGIPEFIPVPLVKHFFIPFLFK